MQSILMDFVAGMFIFMSVAFAPAIVGVLAWVAY
jgi:hypothetical protein